jgi:hypothetical protein
MTFSPNQTLELSKPAKDIVNHLLTHKTEKLYCAYTGEEIPKIEDKELSIGTGGFRWMGFDYIRLWISHMHSYRVNIFSTENSKLYGYVYADGGLHRIKSDDKQSAS